MSRSRAGSGSAPEAGWVPGAEGVRLRSWTWPIENPRGRIQVVHGFSEHLRRYDEVAEALNAAGWSVFGHDHRGHGESEGRRGVLRDFAHYTGDLGAVRAAADELVPGPGVPMLLSHSMGALVSIRYLQLSGEPVPGIVISAPWLGSRMRIPLWKRIAARVLLPLAPELTLHNRLDTTALTRDPVRGESYRTDPKIHRRASAGFLDQVRRAQQKALATGLSPDTRVLMLVPLADPVTDPKVTLGWVSDQLSEERVQLETYPEGRHEPIHDIDRNAVLRTIVEWFENTGAGEASSHPKDDIDE